MSPPDPDEIELSFFGPGFGEALVLHVGSGNWIIIDSCIDVGNSVPASLYYFHQMGLSTADAVKLVVVTHWHDDHIRGMGKVLRACGGARVCIPSVIANRDFLAAIYTLDDGFSGRVTSGVSEIRQVFESDQMRKNPLLAAENQILWSAKGHQVAHGADVELRALSPSGLQGVAMLKRLAELMPTDPNSVKLRGRTPRSNGNDISIASWLSVGTKALLLGADLEVHANPACGWGGVRALSGGLPVSVAEVFKVPHHGSITGHDPLVWQNLLEENPIALISPWNHGSGLPGPDDLERIRDLTSRGFITNLGQMAGSKRRDPVVEKVLREMGIKLESCEGAIGHIQMRMKPGADWRVERFGTAVPLTKAA